MNNRKATLTAATLAAAATLAGCGASEGGSPSSSAPATSSGTEQAQHNPADITFATGMIPHHRQAVEMAALVSKRSENPQVVELATQIKQAQDPEIKLMTGWLRQWGQPVPEHQPSGGHGKTPMPGMMPMAEMSSLEQATGTAFDEMWLRMMIEHHQGAVEMARTELDRGTAPAALDLARRIIAAQQAEIEKMRAMLDSMK